MKRKIRTSSLIAFAALGLCVGCFTFAHAQSVGVTLPTVPTGVSATPGTVPSQTSISWTASTESSGTIEGYYVYRNGAEIADTAGTSMIDGGLLPGLYSYTVAAYDANGNTSAQSSPSTVTILSATTGPTTPTGVTITGTTSTDSIYNPVTLTISWNPSSDSIGVAGYSVYRNGAPVVGVGTTTITGTSVTDTVPPGTYTYTVVAYDAAQNVSAQSAPVTVTVILDDSLPSVPTGVTAQEVASGTVNVSWNASNDSAGIAGYQIFRNNTQIATATASPYSDTGVLVGEAYSYQVAAYDIAGNVSARSEPEETVIVQEVSGPQAPWLVSASAEGTSSVALSWPPSASALAITDYSVYRNGNEIATVTSTNYLDEGLATGTYQYNVSATDVSGAVSPLSATSTVTLSGLSVSSPSLSSSLSSITGAETSLVGALTQFLYFGSNSSQVSQLQSLLAQEGYLPPVDETGFFGKLTQGAVEKFQCNEGIVCTGGAGWGTVGPRTRGALNSLLGSALQTSGVTTTASVTISDSSLEAELQALEAELASLEAQTGQ